MFCHCAYKVLFKNCIEQFKLQEGPLFFKLHQYGTTIAPRLQTQKIKVFYESVLKLFRHYLTENILP